MGGYKRMADFPDSVTQKWRDSVGTEGATELELIDRRTDLDGVLLALGSLGWGLLVFLYREEHYSLEGRPPDRRHVRYCRSRQPEMSCSRSC